MTDTADPTLFREMSRRRPGVARPSPRADLAEKLILMRKRAGLTQAELAAKLGWRQSQISRIENFSGPEPDRARVVAFAAACGATSSEWRFQFDGGEELVVGL